MKTDEQAKHFKRYLAELENSASRLNSSDKSTPGMVVVDILNLAVAPLIIIGALCTKTE